MPQRKQPASITQRCYALLLRLYPARFQQRFGNEMAQVFRVCRQDIQRKHGKAGLVLWYLFIIFDFAASAGKEWLAEIRAWGRRMSDSSLAFEGGGEQLARGGGAVLPAEPQYRRVLWSVALLGLLWGVIIQLYRDYGLSLPFVGRPDFVWLEFACFAVLLAVIPIVAAGWKPSWVGALVALFWTSVLIGHFGYYPLSLAFWNPRPQVPVDLSDPYSYQFLFGLFEEGVGRQLLLVEAGGFLAGWLWGLALHGARRIGRPATT